MKQHFVWLQPVQFASRTSLNQSQATRRAPLSADACGDSSAQSRGTKVPPDQWQPPGCYPGTRNTCDLDQGVDIQCHPQRDTDIEGTVLPPAHSGAGARHDKMGIPLTRSKGRREPLDSWDLSFFHLCSAPSMESWLRKAGRCRLHKKGSPRGSSVGPHGMAEQTRSEPDDPEVTGQVDFFPAGAVSGQV